MVFKKRNESNSEKFIIKKILIFPIIFLSIVLTLPMILSWGPHGHDFLAQSVLSDNQTSIGKLCSSTQENRDAFNLGSTVPDLAVVYYYQEGGKEYKISHNWNFADELMGQAISTDEQCLVYGVAAHLVADGISHTQAVPKAIDTYYIPNWLIHPLLEKKYDSALALKYPELINSTPHMMDALDETKSDRYVQMIDNAMGENSQINVKDELTKLRIAISGNNFYNTQFNPSSGGTWIFQSYFYIDKLTNYLAPYIGTVNFGSIDYYFEKSKEQTISTFNNWGARYQISPHGFDELAVANAKTGNSLTIIFISCFGVPIILSYFKKKKIYLLLIPLSLIGIVIFIYAWI